MKSLPMVVSIEAKPDKVNFMKEQLLKLVGLTKDEEGCLRYDLHQDNKNPAIFVFYEVWATKKLWKRHDLSEHVVEFKKLTADCTENIIFHQLTLL